jgi:hypothetical protein
VGGDAGFEQHRVFLADVGIGSVVCEDIGEAGIDDPDVGVPLLGNFLSLVLRLYVGDVQQFDRLLDAAGAVDVDVAVVLRIDLLSLIWAHDAEGLRMRSVLFILDQYFSWKGAVGGGKKLPCA